MYDEFIVGASSPVWMRAVMVREGDDVVTRCCVVAHGQFMPIEVRVNIPKLIAALRALGFEQATQDQVGGFGSFLKKAVKSVTKNKLVKSVGKVVKKVVKSPVVQVMNPMAAIAAHTTSKALGGKGVIKGPAGKVVDLGASMALKAAGPAAKLPAVGAGALKYVSPKTLSALSVGLSAVKTAKAGSAIAQVAKSAQAQLYAGRRVASHIPNLIATLEKRAASKKQVKAAAKKVKAAAKKAVKVKKAVKKAAPKLAKQVVKSAKVKKSLQTIAKKAKAGSAEAKLASKVIARSAKALDQVTAANSKASGGVRGLLILPSGRVVKSPKGRFHQLKSTTARPETLYRGPNEPALKGNFSAVSGWRALAVGHGPAWGGALDPGNDYDGPLSPVRHSGGSYRLDVAGRLTP